MPHDAGLTYTKPFPLNYCSFAQARMLATSWAGYRVLVARLFFLLFFSFDTARAAVCNSLNRPFRRTIPGVALRIARSARLRGVRHASQREPLARNSRHEVPSDITHTPNLRGFPCRPTRVYRPGNPLRAFCEQNMRRAARRASHPCPHVDPSVPNSHNTRRHFCRPRGLLVPNAERFRTGFPPHRGTREGHSQNAECAWYAASRGTGAVTEIAPLLGSLLTSPVRIGPSSISMHALTHAISLVLLTHSNTHSGTITSGIHVTTRGPEVSTLPPNSAWTRSHHSPARPRTARPD